MQVDAVGRAGLPHFADKLTLIDAVADLDEQLVKVRVQGDVPVVMLDSDAVSVGTAYTTPRPPRRVRRPDLVAERTRDVYAEVEVIRAV